MIRLSTWFIAGIAALPMVVAAQTANQPGGQASTGTAIDQTTTKSPSATTPNTTRTTPDINNPAGSLPSKGTTPSANTTGSASDSTSTAKSQARATKRANANTKTGDVPTYPAPAPDGTPTK